MTSDRASRRRRQGSFVARRAYILPTNRAPHKQEKNHSTKAGSFSLGSRVDFLAIGKSRSVFVFKASVLVPACSLVTILRSARTGKSLENRPLGGFPLGFLYGFPQPPDLMHMKAKG
jgi:hypothetical protein